MERAVKAVRDHGYQIVIGSCMDGESHVSAPAGKRAEELTAMLTDPSIRAVIPPRGGETAIDLLPLLDWNSIAAAEPTWFIGFSDISTLLLPLTLRTGIATLHTNNLLNTPYLRSGQLLTWLDIIASPAGASFAQSPPGQPGARWADDRVYPGLPGPGNDGRWIRLDGGGSVDVAGRLVGGCVETLRHVAGTPYGDVAAFAASHVPEGLIVYVEVAGDDALAVCRSLHGMRLAGFFSEARAVIVARTLAPDSPTLTQHDAVLDALGVLGVPIIAGVGCGHVPPYVPMVNGALGRLRVGASLTSLTQTLC